MADQKGIEALLSQAGTTYPKVTNIPNRKTRDKINRAIKETAEAAIPDYNPGTSVIEARGGYTTPYNKNGILSLRFEDYYYPEKAAHGVTKVTSVTLNLATGYVYRFNQLFRGDQQSQDRINRIIQAQIVSRQIPLFKPFTGVGPDDNYYLTPDSLVIYYEPYEYTPGYAGVLEFIIPYKQLADLINPRGPIPT